MEFGKLTNVEQVNWGLPAEDRVSVEFLQSQKTAANLQIYFGTPAWGHASWIGKIYPIGTRRADFLYYYSRYYNCIELNTTHYRIPTMDQAMLWMKQVPSDFLFCPKVYQGISHTRHGLLDQVLLKEWFNFLEKLADKRGPCFLQLPPYFDYDCKRELFSFLRAWPREFSLALEFRHPSWFQDGQILRPLTQYLQKQGVGLVITDVAGRRDVLHTSISADFSMLRFIGNELHPSDYSRAQDWTQRFLAWQKLGLRQLFLFIHEPDDILAPEMTSYFLEQLSRAGGWTFPASPIVVGEIQLGLL